MSLILVLILIFLIFPSCTESPDVDIPEDKLPLVVEGWIEEGEAPIVLVTRAIDLTTDTDSIGDISEKWGRVTVYEDETPYILTGRLNKNYTPSFIFTSLQLKGSPGHTYRLTVETDQETVEAVCDMIPSASLAGLTPMKVEGTDSLYYLNAQIEDLNPDRYYKFFAQSNDTETRLFPTFLGTFSGHDYDEEEGFDILKGIHSGFTGENSGHYYKSGDRVTVKLCSLTGEIYDFWHTYDNSVALSQNLFFTFDESCPSNIMGGKGYWAAYGTSTRIIKIP